MAGADVVSGRETAGEAIADTMFRFALEDECGVELDGWIYFLGCKEPRAIKIGFTTKSPIKRLRQLQTGNPSPLILLGWYPGCQAQERDLHAQLRDFRLSGEWFRLDERMSEIIAGPVKCMHINNALTGHAP